MNKNLWIDSKEIMLLTRKHKALLIEMFSVARRVLISHQMNVRDVRSLTSWHVFPHKVTSGLLPSRGSIYFSIP